MPVWPDGPPSGWQRPVLVRRVLALRPESVLVRRALVLRPESEQVHRVLVLRPESEQVRQVWEFNQRTWVVR